MLPAPLHVTRGVTCPLACSGVKRAPKCAGGQKLSAQFIAEGRIRKFFPKAT